MLLKRSSRTHSRFQDWERCLLSEVAQKEITLADDVDQLVRRLDRTSDTIRIEIYRLRQSGEWVKWLEQDRILSGG